MPDSFSLDEAAERAVASLIGDINGEQLRRLVAADVLGIIISSRSGQIRDANRAFLDMIGYTRDDLTRNKINWRTLTPPEWAALDENAVREFDANGIVRPYQKEYFHKAGHRIPIALGGTRLPDHENDKVCYIVDLSALNRNVGAPGMPAGNERLRRVNDILEYLKIVDGRLARSLGQKAIYETLLDVLVPHMADWATITMPSGDGTMSIVAGRHMDAARQYLVRRLYGRPYIRKSSEFGSNAAYRTGLPLTRSCLSEADIRKLVKARRLSTVHALGLSSILDLPIVGTRAPLGSVQLVSGPERRPYDEWEAHHLCQVGRRAGSALEDANRFEREHRIADVLQDAALPQRLPGIPGLLLDAYYRPAKQEALIGGDWYDAFSLTDGRLVVSIGDVAGSGITAAAEMGKVRQLIRGAAHGNLSPARILDAVDRSVCSDPAFFATAFVGIIDMGATSLCFSSAGHNPPLLRKPDGSVIELTAHGLPLGCRSLLQGEDETIPFTSGSEVLLYTDGLVETGSNILAALDRLVACFQRRGEATEPLEAFAESVLGGHRAADDIALLSVSVEEERSR